MALHSERNDHPAASLDRYLGVGFPDGRFAIQEVGNPNGWVVSSVVVAIEP